MAVDREKKVVVKNEGAGLMRVTVQVGPRRFDEDLAAQAMIRPDVQSLNDAMATTPARFAEWAMLEALAISECDGISGQIKRVETDIKDREARAYLEITAATTAPGEKPPTIPAITAMVQVDAARLQLVARKQELESALLDAEDARRKLAVGRKTMEERKESLLALASNWRKEMDGKLAAGIKDPAQYRPGGR